MGPPRNTGHLLTTAPPSQPRLIGADASHAWLSVYCPGAGWIDLDPTNNQTASDKHITVAWGRDYDDVSPILRVILGGGRQSIGGKTVTGKTGKTGKTVTETVTLFATHLLPISWTEMLLPT
jgi:transglutaminase-like putative cysteine protease